MSFEHRVVFHVPGLPVTATVVTTWALVITVAALAAIAGGHLQERPSSWQAVLEWGIGLLDTLLREIAGEAGSKYLPLVVTIAVFVALANLSGVLPFVEAPTADLNTPVALALVVFFSVHYVGVRESGPWGYLRSFARPSIFMLPFNLLSQITRTFSLAIRLFGNMLSHQIIVAVLLLILPLIVPAILQIFGLFIGVLQAYIFTILSIVYIGGAVRAEGSL
jgi:F-type H+-transporting ATPase subunit a